MKLLLVLSLIVTAAALTSCSGSRRQSFHRTHHRTGKRRSVQGRQRRGPHRAPWRHPSACKPPRCRGRRSPLPSPSSLQAMQRGTEASGWLTADQAARVQPGMEVELGTAKGSVLRIEKAAICHARRLRSHRANRRYRRAAPSPPPSASPLAML